MITMCAYTCNITYVPYIKGNVIFFGGGSGLLCLIYYGKILTRMLPTRGERKNICQRKPKISISKVNVKNSQTETVATTG